MAVRAGGEAAVTASTVDPTELAKFNAIAARWWDPRGPMRPLHILNPLRIAYILDHHRKAFAATSREPLHGCSMLDVGCGGGLLAEPLARLGAVVTAIDPEQDSVAAGRAHAAEAGLAIDYRRATLEDLVDEGRRFDVVLALEVIEHVADQPALVANLLTAARPGGLLVMATLSRTAASFALGVVAAERLLGWLPAGTHDWRRFMRPHELARLVRQGGGVVQDVSGVAYEPAYERFRITRDAGVNYMLAARRRGF